MGKDRIAVTCSGRTAFYACMYEDIRQCAMDCGWAVSLHGSLSSDMDIMAMPWVDNAVSFKEMVDRVSKLFKDNELSSQYVITYNEKPYNRVVATIPIFADFYLDISTITADVVPRGEVSGCKQRLIDYKNITRNLPVGILRTDIAKPKPRLRGRFLRRLRNYIFT